MSPCVDRWFSVIVKECDEIFHLRRNECLEFIVILLCLSVLVEKSCMREIFSREVNLLLKSDNYDITIFNLFYFLD